MRPVLHWIATSNQLQRLNKEEKSQRRPLGWIGRDKIAGTVVKEVKSEHRWESG